MVRTVYQFYGKGSTLSLGINFERKNANISVTPAFDPNRKMGNVAEGSHVYDYTKTKFFSITPGEAAQLLKDLGVLEAFVATPNQAAGSEPKLKSLFHDPGKNQEGQNFFSMCGVSVYQGKLQSFVTHQDKGTKAMDTIRYFFHDDAEVDNFKSFLQYVRVHLVPTGAFMEELIWQLQTPEQREAAKANKKKGWQGQGQGQSQGSSVTSGQSAPMQTSGAQSGGLGEF